MFKEAVREVLQPLAIGFAILSSATLGFWVWFAWLSTDPNSEHAAEDFQWAASAGMPIFWLGVLFTAITIFCFRLNNAIRRLDQEQADRLKESAQRAEVAESVRRATICGYHNRDLVARQLEAAAASGKRISRA